MNKRKKRFSSIHLVCLVLFVCILLGLAVFNAENLSKSASEDDLEVSSETQESSEQESSAIEESIEESCEPVSYKSDAKYTKKLDVFSKDVKKHLNELIESNYVVLYDAASDRILYDKAGNKQCFPASTTKLMTAIISSDYFNKDDIIVVGDEIELIEYDSSVAGLREGMEISYEALLDALLVPSGNDAAYTIAAACARKYMNDTSLESKKCIEIFAGMMNKAAAEMGCTGTHFTVPDGYHDDDHYVTAEDMVKIAACAVKKPVIMQSCKKSEAEWKVIAPVLPSEPEETEDEDNEESTESKESVNSDPSEIQSSLTSSGSPEMSETELSWENHNKLITKDSGQYSEFATGMKTGFTDEAWTCVVASAEMGGHTMIAVVMKSPSNYQKFREANYLFEEGFRLYGLNYTHNDEWVN